MATGTLDISTDPDCSMATDPDIAPTTAEDPHNAMAPGDSTCHSSLHGPGSGTAL